MKVQDILTDESKWTKGALWRDRHGNDVSSRGCNVVQFCLSGAIVRAYPSFRARDKIWKKCETRIHLSIPNWNDKPDRTFAEVRALIEELDI